MGFGFSVGGFLFVFVLLLLFFIVLIVALRLFYNLEDLVFNKLKLSLVKWKYTMGSEEISKHAHDNNKKCPLCLVAEAERIC